jgi:hypothetical protein
MLWIRIYYILDTVGDVIRDAKIKKDITPILQELTDK